MGKDLQRWKLAWPRPDQEKWIPSFHGALNKYAAVDYTLAMRVGALEGSMSLDIEVLGVWERTVGGH